MNENEREAAFFQEKVLELQKYTRKARLILSEEASSLSPEQKKDLEDFALFADLALRNRLDMKNAPSAFSELNLRAVALGLAKE